LHSTLFPPLPPETRRLLNTIPALVEKTFPIPGRFRRELPANIKKLSRLLTGDRGQRSLSYLGHPNLLGAYLHYFLPWNLYRLCRLLPALDISLYNGDTVVDLGCGPLTFAAALWISRPELRSQKLEFLCVDHCGPALEAGKDFFAALTGGRSPWKLHTIRDSTENFSLKNKPVALVCAINLFNEIDSKLPQGDVAAQNRRAKNAARLLNGFTSDTGSILVVEPGIPNSGQFITLLRTALMGCGRPVVSPCPHELSCPMPGGFSLTGNERVKKRWCHFAFDTEDAAAALHRLSAAAGIPKERAVLSFLFTARAAAEKDSAPLPSPVERRGFLPVRVISDAFSLPHNRCGRYGCSARGLVLLTGERSSIEKTASGMLLEAELGEPAQRDPKSGALMVNA